MTYFLNMRSVWQKFEQPGIRGIIGKEESDVTIIGGDSFETSIVYKIEEKWYSSRCLSIFYLPDTYLQKGCDISQSQLHGILHHLGTFITRRNKSKFNGFAIVMDSITTSIWNFAFFQNHLNVLRIISTLDWTKYFINNLPYEFQHLLDYFLHDSTFCKNNLRMVCMSILLPETTKNTMCLFFNVISALSKIYTKHSRNLQNVEALGRLFVYYVAIEIRNGILLDFDTLSRIQQRLLEQIPKRKRYQKNLHISRNLDVIRIFIRNIFLKINTTNCHVLTMTVYRIMKSSQANNIQLIDIQSHLPQVIELGNDATINPINLRRFGFIQGHNCNLIQFNQNDCAALWETKEKRLWAAFGLLSSAICKKNTLLISGEFDNRNNYGVLRVGCNTIVKSRDEKTHFKSATSNGGFGDGFRRPFKRASMPAVKKHHFQKSPLLFGLSVLAKVWRDKKNILRVQFCDWTSSFKASNKRYIVIAFKGLRVHARLIKKHQ
jgi:hypothetical protein